MGGLSLTNVAPEVANRLSICINHVAALPSRVVLAEISKVFGELNPENIPTLLSLTDKHIDHMERGAATKHQGLLQKFFLGALKFRHDNPSVERSLANSIENSTCVALVRLALKLPEASLRPLLFKIFSWGTDEDNLLCLLPLFTLYGHLAAALKSMFPIFTGSLSTYLVKILPKIADEKSEISDSREDRRDVLVCVLKVLQQIFMYDNGEFLDEKTTQDLIPILIDQLELTNMDGFDEFCDEYLIPTISQAAAAISDDAIWRPLNYRLLLKTRSEEPLCRLAALKCIDSVVDKLGDDYQALLQESAPQFLAELLEDDDERVEKKMEETVRKIEEVFGESLQNYF